MLPSIAAVKENELSRISAFNTTAALLKRKNSTSVASDCDTGEEEK